MTEEVVALRPHLRALAYRLLGSAAGAEDAVQEAFARWETLDASSIDSPKNYLSKLVTNHCLDELKSARARREVYVGAWLPEPIVEDETVERAESVAVAFLVLLDALSPLERAAFLLHEVFDHDYAEIARILERDEPAIRKLVERAKGHLRAKKPRFSPTREAQESLLRGFLMACATGDVASLETLLEKDVRAVSDGGGKSGVARNTIVGANDVARFVVGVARRASPTVHVTIEGVNGAPAIVLRDAGVAVAVLSFECDGERIQAIYVQANPEKLRGLSAMQSAS